MERLKEFLAIFEARTANWVSADGSMSGFEAFAKDWNDTVQRGGTRREVATRWGISDQEASNRAQKLSVIHQFKMLNFTSQRGVRAPREAGGSSTRSGSWTPREVDPEEIIAAIARNGGNVSKTAVELGMSYSELYGLKRKIEVARPDLMIGRVSKAGRPRMSADDSESLGIPSNHQILGMSKLDPSSPAFRQKFASIWNKGSSKEQVYTMFAELHEADKDFPLLKPERINWLAWKIGKFDPELLQKFPDQRRERWRLKKAAEQEAAQVAAEDEFDMSLFDVEGEPEPKIDDAIEDIFKVDEPAVDDSVATDKEIDDLFGIDSEATADTEFDPDKEFVDVWASATSEEDAKKKLKRAGWSPSAIKYKVSILKDKLKKF